VDEEAGQTPHDGILRRVSYIRPLTDPFCSELKKLKAVFDTLDIDGSGAIGVEELFDPFIALGLADTI
jgi:centrin-2